MTAGEEKRQLARLKGRGAAVLKYLKRPLAIEERRLVRRDGELNALLMDTLIEVHLNSNN